MTGDRSRWIAAFLGCLLVLSFCVGAEAKKAQEGPEKAQEMPLRAAFKFVSAFGQRGNGQGQFYAPTGIAVDALGTVYVADTGNDRVQKFDARDRYLTEVGSFGWDNAQFNQPTGVATGRGGLEVYVADSRNSRIQIFGASFQLLAVVGGRGVDEPVSLGTPGGIAVSDTGELYTSDTDADQVVQISTYSRTDQSFGGYGYGAGRLRRPMGLAVGEKGTVYACDSENNRIAVFDRFGNFKKSLGEEALLEPSGVCLGPEHSLFVADTGHNRVVAFDLDTGQVAGVLGGPDAGTGSGQFKGPMGVAFGFPHLLYVLDTGNNRVQKFQVLILRR